MKSFSVIFLLVSMAMPAFSQSYRGYNCQELWETRNEIYKDAGYCFKTKRAIRHFGNAGCRFDRIDDVPLSRKQQREINAIVAQEKVYRCPK